MISKTKFFTMVCLAGGLFFSPSVWAENKAQEFFDLGQAAQNANETAKAIDFYQKSIEADTDFALAYSALASLYLDQNGNADDVIWLFQQAADIEPQNPAHYTNMCRAYFQFQKFDWAQSACLKALSLDPNANAAKMTLAWVYLLGKSQPADAIKCFKELLDKIPNPKIYYGLGIAYARNNEQANALDVITTLRGMGEETLAGQLEKMMRTSNEAVAPAARPIPSPNTGASEIIEANPKPPVSRPSLDTQAMGTLRIQLKGHLPQTAPATEAKQNSKEKSSDDVAYGPEDYKPLSLQERQDRVRRMRGNTGKISGKATIATQTQIPAPSSK